MNNRSELESLILETLSFYEPMSFSKIVFDMDTETLKSYPHFDNILMASLLENLEKKGFIKKITNGTEAQWIRVQKKRTWWKKFF